MATTTRRRLDRHERRESIVSAAREVFQKQGVAAATMDEIARTAGVSKGGLYLHFRSKDELCMALASEMLEAVSKRFEDIKARVYENGLEEFRALVSAYTTVVLDNPTTIRNSLIWLANNAPADTTTDGFLAYRARVHALLVAFVGAVERGQREGVIRDKDGAATVAVQVWASILGAIMFAVNADELDRRFPSQMDRESIVPGVIDYVTRGIAVDR